MTAVVERIRQQIDRLAPDEVQELLTDLQRDYAIRLIDQEDSKPKVTELSEVDRAKIEILRSDIQVGAEQLNRGEGIEIDWEAKLARRHQAFAARQTV